MTHELSGYAVGPLLYCPANAHGSIADALKNEFYPKPFSLAFCLEDTVRSDAVAEAEQMLSRTLERICAARAEADFYLPLIFIRVRSPQQLCRLAQAYRPYASILTGFILPKFFIENCGDYLRSIEDVRRQGLDYYYMPIFESPSMIDLHTRYDHLHQVKSVLEDVSDRILNIRVGGNDLSHAFGLRRRVSNTIYDVKPVADLLVDIVTTFATRYVVSGPVWEYYNGPGWDTGLRRELELDLLSGFVGKTVIHPNQIPVVNEMLQVSPEDYADAQAILGWDGTDGHLVGASAASTRMNEYNTHFRWAERVAQLARYYGVRPR